MSFLPLHRFSLLITFLVAVSPARSAVTFSNLGTNDTYDTLNSWVISPTQVFAAAFTASTTGTLTSIRLPLGLSGVPNQNLQVSLLTGLPGGSAPTLLESWTLGPGDLSSSLPCVNCLEVLNSVVQPTLQANSSYWLRLSSAVTNGAGYRWFINETGDSGLFYSVNQGTSWGSFPTQVAPAFEVNVNVNAIPEPSTYLLLLSGFGALAWRHRRAS
jgi:hypothetical protein